MKTDHFRKQGSASSSIWKKTTYWHKENITANYLLRDKEGDGGQESTWVN